MDSILQVTNLTKQFDTFTLSNINLTVPKGSIVGFIGENGAGKTTTIKSIIGAIHKDQGEVFMFGKRFDKQEKDIMQDIAVIMEGSFFYDDFTPQDISKVLQNIYHKWDNEVYESYLAQFKLPANKKIKEFSKGMRMKLSISIALSYDAKLFILDEPTSGLDPIVRNEILDIFLDLIQDEERAILLSSHITSDLEKIADYITFIHEGKIIFSKTKDELIYEYGVLKCSAAEFEQIDHEDIIGYQKSQFHVEALVPNKQLAKQKYSHILIDPASIEDIMLFYVRGAK